MARPKTVLTITTRLNKNDYEKLIACCSALHISIASYIRQAVNQYARNHVPAYLQPASQEERWNYPIGHDARVSHKMPIKNISCRVDVPTLTNIDLVCAYHHRGRSWVMRHCVLTKIEDDNK
ncbi:hypothetical protein A200_08368 [Parascardovia denticolens IPLA 20019]|nr:hypothetical protein A200_08368 [Parascardovia denticolens IPLA 20019]